MTATHKPSVCRNTPRTSCLTAKLRTQKPYKRCASRLDMLNQVTCAFALSIQPPSTCIHLNVTFENVCLYNRTHKDKYVHHLVSESYVVLKHTHHPTSLKSACLCPPIEAVSRLLFVFARTHWVYTLNTTCVLKRVYLFWKQEQLEPMATMLKHNVHEIHGSHRFIQCFQLLILVFKTPPNATEQ